MQHQTLPVENLEGPIAIFGVGGFIGINLLQKILAVRSDVIGFSHDPEKSWRLKKASISSRFVTECNLLNRDQVNSVIKKYTPQTIFNLAAYGSYSWDTDSERIYQTNLNATVEIIESLKRKRFTAYIHAGSQSEYGLNAAAPAETDATIPNSHYAVSKLAVRYLLSYFGAMEQLPVVHLRLYSIFAPWKEPRRLMPTLIRQAIRHKLPAFVAPNISRDYVYIDDCIEALITVATGMEKKHYGEVFNVASGKKTTMKELALIAKKLFNIDKAPVFEGMKKRDWDLADWWGNPKKINSEFGWSAKTTLRQGLIKFYNYETKT